MVNVPKNTFGTLSKSTDEKEKKERKKRETAAKLSEFHGNTINPS